MFTLIIPDLFYILSFVPVASDRFQDGLDLLENSELVRSSSRLSSVFSKYFRSVGIVLRSIPGYPRFIRKVRVRPMFVFQRDFKTRFTSSLPSDRFREGSFLAARLDPDRSFAESLPDRWNRSFLCARSADPKTVNDKRPYAVRVGKVRIEHRYRESGSIVDTESLLDRWR